jgi:hypothetical protein
VNPLCILLEGLSHGLGRNQPPIGALVVAIVIVGTAAFMIWHSRQAALVDHLRAMDSGNDLLSRTWGW